MPIYYYWGDDDYRLNQAIADLRDQALDSSWASFNYDRIAADQSDGPIQALNQAMTPPFGLGRRFVWLQDTTIGQRCPESVLEEMARTLPQVPETTVLLMTSSSKPDGRSKFTKLLQKHGKICEFSTIPPWKTDLILQQVQQVAQIHRVPLSPEAADLLADAVGNDTRQLHNELQKLAIYWQSSDQPLPLEVVAELVTVSTQSSLKLAIALREGNTSLALQLITELLGRNEPALRIVATLVSQFRLWLWIKLMLESGERSDTAIAQAAEVGNPKRIYFLKKEVRSLPLSPLQKVLPLLLELETSLKQGMDEQAALQTKAIEICQLFC